MSHHNLYTRASAAAVMSALLFAVPAEAQDAGSPSEEDTERAAVQDVVYVTARRTTERASQTPVTVTVLDSEALAKANIQSESDLRALLPGVTVRATISSNQLNYTIRGQSRDAFSDTRPGVLPYINEVQIGGAGGASAFYDLENIQVLKGPQGTLFGRSATGGAVLFSTARADLTEFGGYASALAGDLDALNFEGAINVPIVADQVAFRLAGVYAERDGYQRNLLDFTAPGGAFNAFVPFSMGAGGLYSGPGGPNYAGQDLPDELYGDYERKGVRGTLAIDLGQVRNDLVVDYYEADGRSVQPVLRAFNPQALVPIQFIPTFSAALDAALTAQLSRDPFTVNTDGNSRYRNENLIVTNTTEFDLGFATLKNIIGFTNIDSASSNEVDGTILPLSSNFPIGYTERIIEETEQFSNEIQLSGESGPLTYVTGLYYSDEEAATPTFPTHFFVAVANNGAFALDNTTYAGYGQITYELGDTGISLTGGLRYTNEEVGKRLLPGDDTLVTFGPTPPPGISYTKSETYDHVSWTIGADYQATAEHLLYVTSRRSYKSGGYNGVLTPADGDASVAGDSYDQMQITDIEAGWKFDGIAGGVPARVEVAAFYNWIKDDQRVIYSNAPGPTALTTNVPEATLGGIEVSGQFRPTENLTLGGAAVYTDAEFGDEPVFVFGSGNVVYDQVPDTPEFTASLFADFVTPIRGDIDLLLHGDLFYQDEAFIAPISTENNNGASVIPSYTVTNFRVGLQNQVSGWSAIANLKNAFDETYFVGGMPVSALYATNMLIPGEPQTFTFELRKTF